MLWQPQFNWLSGRPPIERTLPAQSVQIQAEEADGHKLSAVGAVQEVDLRHLTRRQLVAAFHSAEGEADRVRSAVALGSVSASEPSAVAVLIAAIQDSREGVRRAAAHGLAHGGDAAVGALLKLLQETSAPGESNGGPNAVAVEVSCVVFGQKLMHERFGPQGRGTTTRRTSSSSRSAVPAPHPCPRRWRSPPPRSGAR